MFRVIPARLLGVLLLAPLAMAQGSPSRLPDPLPGTFPSVQVAPPTRLTYTSAFAGYRPFDPAKPGGWREANESVRKLGGWRVYAREAIEAPSSNTAPRDAPAPAKADPHAEHGRRP